MFVYWIQRKQKLNQYSDMSLCLVKVSSILNIYIVEECTESRIFS